MAIDRPRNITGGVRRQDETREQFRERMDEARANRGPWPSARTSTGLDEFELMNQEKNRPLADIQREAREASRRGLMYNRNTGGWVDDTMGNRSAMANANPYAQRGLQAGDPQMPPMTEPQMEWARKAQEKQTGAGALGKMGDKMAGMNFSFGVNPMFGAGMQAASAAMQGFQNAQQSPAPNPYMSARQQNIANAKAAGEFDKIQAEYNERNKASGLVMDANGNITRSPEAYAKIKQEERDLNRGMWREPQTLSNEEIASGATSKTFIPSRYGNGSITTYAPGAKKPQSMVRDEFGKMVPMNEYLERKSYVQATKGMTGGSSVLPPPKKAATKIIPPNPLVRKSEERELFPNAIGERTQFNDWQAQLAEAKRRGAEGMAKYRQNAAR